MNKKLCLPVRGSLVTAIASLLVLLFSGCKVISENDKTTGIYDSCSFTVLDNVVSEISPLIVGFNVVYPHEKDQIWQDGTIAGLLKQIPASLIRYPGGTVTSFYHWDNLSGNGWADSFDPEYKLTDKPETDFMDIDEYFALVRETGATPLVGINMSSARRWNKTEEGIAEALALMKYCKDNNFIVKYWFLDNEPYQPDSNGGSKTIEEYAGLINLFAPAMKEYDSQIKIIINWNAGFTNKRADYEKLLTLAGNNIDIIDVHWYWAWKQADQMGKWLAESPMELWTNNTYIREIADFRNMVAGMGFPEIGLATLEWNVGPGNTGETSLTGHQCAMIQAEMMMQFIIGGLDMATFWPLHWPGNDFGDRGMVNYTTNVVAPNFGIFKFLGEFRGSKLKETVTSETMDHTIYFAGMSENNDTMRVCFLNKNPFKVQVNLNSEFLDDLTLKEMTSYVLQASGLSSELQSLRPLKMKNEAMQFLSPEFSITMITLVKK